MLSNKYIIALIGYLFCVQGVVYAQNVDNVDFKLLHKINSNQSEFWRGYSKAISNTTTYVSLSIPITEAVIGWIEHDEQKLQNALYMGATFGASAFMTFSLKRIFNRPRPAVTYPDLITPYPNLSVHSFPSGHTYEAFSSATILSLYHPKWYIIAPAYLWAGSVGYSRMNLGVHYPTDVLAGAILGSGTAYLTFIVNQLIQKRQQKRKSIDMTAFNSL